MIKKELLLEMTLSDVKKAFKNSISEELWEQIEKLLDTAESALPNKYSSAKTWPPKYPLLLKALSLLKKEPEEVILKTLTSLIPILYDMSFIMAHSNLMNNMEPSMKKWFLDYMKLKNMDEFNNWKSAANEHERALSEIVQDKLLGDEKSEPVYQENDFKIYKITNHVMARKIGGDTSWCVSSPTSGKKHCAAYLESLRAELYALVFNESKEKYLLALWPNKKYNTTLDNVKNIDSTNFKMEMCKVILEIIEKYYNLYFTPPVKVMSDKLVNKEVTSEKFLNSMIEGIINYKNFENDLKKYININSIQIYDLMQNLQEQSIFYAVEKEFGVSYDDLMPPLKKLKDTFYIGSHMYHTIPTILLNWIEGELFKKYEINPDVLEDIISKKVKLSTLLNYSYELKDRNDDAPAEEEIDNLLFYYKDISGRPKEFTTFYYGVKSKIDIIAEVSNIFNILDHPEKYPYGPLIAKKYNKIGQIERAFISNIDIILACNKPKDLRNNIWENLTNTMYNKLENYFHASILKADLRELRYMGGANAKIVEIFLTTISQLTKEKR